MSNGSNKLKLIGKSYSIFDIIKNQDLKELFPDYLPELLVMDETGIAYFKSYKHKILDHGIAHRLYKYLIADIDNNLTIDSEYLQIPQSGGILICLSIDAPYAAYKIKLEYIVDLLKVQFQEMSELKVSSNTIEKNTNFNFYDQRLMEQSSMFFDFSNNIEQIFEDRVRRAGYMNISEKFYENYINSGQYWKM